jgi:hypothetical protein
MAGAIQLLAGISSASANTMINGAQIFAMISF